MKGEKTHFTQTNISQSECSKNKILSIVSSVEKDSSETQAYLSSAKGTALRKATSYLMMKE